MINNPNKNQSIGLMNKEEFNHAIALIKIKESVKNACYLILVSGFLNTAACLKEKVSRPTVNKYINLIKIEWRKNIANS